MDELIEAELAMLPPMVQMGSHSVLVHVTPKPDGVHVELRHPNVGAKTYRVLTQGVVTDAAGVLRWIELVAPGVRGRLDAEAAATMRTLGYA